MFARLCLSAAAAVLLAAAAPASAPLPEVRSNGGADRYLFDVPAGRVVVNLPDDMAAGDTITGTVSVEPRGDGDAERRANAGELQGYVIDVGRGPVPLDGGRFLLHDLAGPELTLSLRAADGRSVGGLRVSLAPPPVPRRADFVLPGLGQAGRPIEIIGPFDGDASNTRVRIGGQPVPVLAESPRSVVVQTSPALTGPSEITVQEGGRNAAAPYRAVGLKLEAPKTNLMKGESTEVRMQVQGLQGLTAPVTVTVAASPTVALSGGNSQALSIDRGQVSPGGSYAAAFTVQALQAGPFEVTARLFDFPRDGMFPDAMDMNGMDSVADLLERLKGLSDDEKAVVLRATLKALDQRIAWATSDSSGKWLAAKRKLVVKALDRLGYSH